MKKSKEFVQQPSEYPENLHNILYHSHLRLASNPLATPSSSPKSSSTSPSSSFSPTGTMVPHIADLAADTIEVQTASTIQYHRAHPPTEISNALVRRPSHGMRHDRHQSKPHTPDARQSSVSTSHGMRHLRHPSNLPLYTPDTQPNSNKSRRLRDSFKPLFHIFSPSDSPSSLAPEKQWDDSRKVGSKAKVLQETSVNSPSSRQSRGGSLSSSFSKDSHHQQQQPQRPIQRPTRYFRREQSNAAILEEMKCEGLLGGRGGGTTKSKKRKGRDSPDLEKPLPPLVPSMTRRNSEDKYWAGVADDIARRASVMSG